MTNGIDTSVHNGYINFPAVKAAGIEFVMLRAGYGNMVAYPNQKDARFEESYKNAKAAGLHVGAYHYMYATTVEAAKAEAQGFLNAIKGKQFDYPVALDIEERTQYNLPNSTVQAIVKAFIDIVEAAGYFVSLYSYEAFLSAKMSADFREKYDAWCANITRAPQIKFGMHQCSFTGKVNGISGDVDLNRAYRDYPAIIKGAGLNGYAKSKSAEKPAEKPALKGDLNGDGKVNVADIALLAAHVKGKKPLKNV